MESKRQQWLLKVVPVLPPRHTARNSDRDSRKSYSRNPVPVSLTPNPKLEESNEEDTAAGIHGRVQGIGCLTGQGWSDDPAGRELGVSHQTLRNWVKVDAGN